MIEWNIYCSVNIIFGIVWKNGIIWNIEYLVVMYKMVVYVCNVWSVFLVFFWLWLIFFVFYVEKVVE